MGYIDIVCVSPAPHAFDWSTQMTILPRERNFVTVLLSLLAAAVGIGLMYWSTSPEFLHALGEALFIAGFIALVVDPFVKQRLLREASKDIFHHLLGFGLPAEIKERLKRIVADTELYRQNMKTTCSFSYVANEVLIDVEQEFEVVNPTTIRIPFRHELQFEKNEHPQLKKTSLTANRGSYTDTSPKLTPLSGETDVLAYRGRKVWIEPNKTYSFRADYSLRFPCPFFYFQHFGKPTINAVLLVRQKPPDLTVCASPAEIENQGEWSYVRLFMPGEHFVVRWERVQSTTAPQ